MFTDNIKDMGTNEDNYNVTILIAEDEESNVTIQRIEYNQVGQQQF